jgi:hypothetical protein
LTAFSGAQSRSMYNSNKNGCCDGG